MLKTASDSTLIWPKLTTKTAKLYSPRMQLLRTKPLERFHESSGLKRCLDAMDLVLLGVGAIIGAGVFVLTGVAAATKAGPAIILSFLLSGLACAFSAFSYAELSSSVGGSGSAYGYSYAGMGEIFAWIIGWSLILEYSIATATVAIGWSSYLNNIFLSMGIHLPHDLVTNPSHGGILNLPAVAIISAVTALLCIGVRESARINNIVVFIKLTAIIVFIVVAAGHIQPQNWHPFLPFGWEGITQGAAIIFFAYIGFDAVSTAADEAIDPQRNLPIGIIGSLLICTILYIIVAGLLTGVANYQTLDTASPVSDVLLRLGYHFASGVVSAGAIAGLTTVILVMFFGLTRIFYAMSKDKLLPPIFSTVHPKTQTPVAVILVCGTIIAFVSGLMPIHIVAELVNIGTLSAFFMVSIGVIFLRKKHPNLQRKYKVPFYPYTPILGAILCFYLMLNLSAITWTGFLSWMVIGLIIYFSYSYHHSRLHVKHK